MPISLNSSIASSEKHHVADVSDRRQNDKSNYRKNQKHTGHLPYEVKEITNQEYRQIIDKLSNDELLQIINELPEGYKWVFNLAVIDGYEHKEIAAMLNISQSTSRSQLVRARKVLQEKISKKKVKVA